MSPNTVGRIHFLVTVGLGTACFSKVSNYEREPLMFMRLTLGETCICLRPHLIRSGPPEINSESADWGP